MINFYRFNAWLFTVFTIAGIIGFFLTPKAPRIDFDLIGFLYLLDEHCADYNFHPDIFLRHLCRLFLDKISGSQKNRHQSAVKLSIFFPCNIFINISLQNIERNCAA